MSEPGTDTRTTQRLLAEGRISWRDYFARLRRATKQGDALAQEALGAWLLEGARSRSGRILLRRNARSGVGFLKQASAHGLATAQFRLACCYDSGDGVRKNLRVARQLYQRAAAQGMSEAAVNIAVLCRQANDRRGEKRWLCKAVAMGNIDAEVQLARLELASRCSSARRRHWRARLRQIARTTTQEGEDAAALLLDLGW